VEIGFGLHRLCSRITTHSEEEQRDMGYRGLTHKNDSLHSHEKHMDIRSAGSSLSGGDSLVAWCAELYSVRPEYRVLIGILVEAARGIRDTVMCLREGPSYNSNYE